MGRLLDLFADYARMRIDMSVAAVGYDGTGSIPEDMAFLQWLDDLRARHEDRRQALHARQP
jgi:hypothetical protein